MYKTPVQVFAHDPVTPLAQAIKKSTEEVQVVEQEAESAGQELTFVAPAPMLPPESEHRPDYQPPGEGTAYRSSRNSASSWTPAWNLKLSAAK